MLKLREPIQLKTQGSLPVVSGAESFARRLMANYEMMTAGIEEEDLLHVFTQPPEIFLEEGTSPSILQMNSRIENNNRQKYEIINNLVNRLMISPELHMTYQDQVYITGILHKLGIRDQETFMRQVRTILSGEHELVRELKELRTEVPKKEAERDSASKTAKESAPENHYTAEKKDTWYYLHQQIFDRLQTARIYDTVWNFMTDRQSTQVMSREKLLLSEQLGTSRVLERTQLQKELYGGEPTLVYHQENRYEEELPEELPELTAAQTHTHISEAMLLSLISRIDRSRSYSRNENRSEYLITAENLYQTSENTIRRYAQNLTQPLIRREILKEREEERLLHRVSAPGEIQTIPGSEQEEQERTAPERNGEEIRKELLQTLVTVQSSLSQENSETVINHQEPVLLRRQAIPAASEDGSAAVTPGAFLQEESELAHPAAGEGEISSEEAREQALNARGEEIRKEVERIEQQNRENEIHYREALRILQEKQAQGTAPTAVSGSERGRRESLEALENPELILRQYAQEEQQRQEQQQGMDKAFLEALTPETRQYFEVIDRYINHPGPAQMELLQHQDALDLLNNDIREIAQQKLQEQLPAAEMEYPRIEEEAAVLPPGLELPETETVKTENVRRRTQEQRDLELVHKTQTTLTREDLEEELTEQRSLLAKERTQISESREETKVINRSEQRTQQVNERIDDRQLTELVRRSVAGQMGDLSDQVYRRLEHRLQNEKRRRGL